MALLALTACENDTDPRYEVGTYKESAQFLSPDSGTEYILKDGTAGNTFEVYSWSPTDYGIDIGRQYTIQMDLYDNDFESPVKLVTTTATQARFTVEEINNATVKLAGIESEDDITAVHLKMRIVTSPYGGEEGVTPIGGFPTVNSDILELRVTPFAPPAPEYPSAVYMIGSDFGGWNWDDSSVAEMIPVNGKPAQFWCVRYFNANSGFKWNTKKGWGGDFSSLGDDVNLGKDGDGNSIVSEDGMYMIFMDFDANRITCEPAKIYGMGDCFGNWDEGANPCANVGNKVSFTTNGSGELRLYAGSEFSSSAWWTREFIFFDGVISYRGNGGDQDRLVVDAGKKVTLDFNSGTATIE